VAVEDDDVDHINETLYLGVSRKGDAFFTTRFMLNMRRGDDHGDDDDDDDDPQIIPSMLLPDQTGVAAVADQYYLLPRGHLRAPPDCWSEQHFITSLPGDGDYVGGLAGSETMYITGERKSNGESGLSIYYGMNGLN
jgi:hypothetical protein